MMRVRKLVLDTYARHGVETWPDNAGPNPFYARTDQGLIFDGHVLWSPWGRWHLYGGSAGPCGWYVPAMAELEVALGLVLHTPHTRFYPATYKVTLIDGLAQPDAIPTEGNLLSCEVTDYDEIKSSWSTCISLLTAEMTTP